MHKSKAGYGVWNKELKRIKISRTPPTPNPLGKGIMSQPFTPLKKKSLSTSLQNSFNSDQINNLTSPHDLPFSNTRVDFSQNLRKSSVNISTPQYIGELKEGMK